MIYLCYGNDRQAVREYSKNICSDLVDTEIFHWPEGLVDQNLFLSYIGGQDLFGRRHTIIFSGVLENVETAEMFLNRLKEISESESIFILQEENINKPIVERFEKIGANIQKIVLNENSEKGSKESKRFKKSKENNKAKTTEFSIFELSDALGKRNKKDAWILYTRARAAGQEPEQIQGILWWQLKSMLIASRSSSSAESGLNPYVYGKSKKFSENYSKQELQSLASKLVALYHQTRQGKVDFDLGLEQFILGLS